MALVVGRRQVSLLVALSIPRDSHVSGFAGLFGAGGDGAGCPVLALRVEAEKGDGEAIAGGQRRRHLHPVRGKSGGDDRAYIPCRVRLPNCTPPTRRSTRPSTK